MTEQNLFKLQCDICGKSFNSQEKLGQHIDIVHIGLLQFKCKSCGKNFENKHELEQHKGMESGKIFKCGLCDKKFTLLHSLNIHKQKFHKENTIMNSNGVQKSMKEFHCDSCNKKFISALTLKNHIQAIHLKLLFPCKLCKKRFETYSQQFHHTKNVHEGFKKRKHNILPLKSVKTPTFSISFKKTRGFKNLSFKCYL